MLLLLVRDLLAIVSGGGTENYPFTLMTVSKIVFLHYCWIELKFALWPQPQKKGQIPHLIRKSLLLGVDFLQLLIIRACGIVLPMFVFIRIITAIQNSMSRPHQVSNS